MRDQMSAFDIARIVQDIDTLAGARCKKMYQPHYELIVLRLNPKGHPTQDLVIVRGKRLYFSQRDRPMPKQPSQFAMLLRKHLNNARFFSSRQFGFDRILKFSIPMVAVTTVVRQEKQHRHADLEGEHRIGRFYRCC